MSEASENKSGAASGRSPLPATLLLLTFTTGLVDAVSFIGLGNVFTANMTGNVVFLAFALAGVAELSAMRSLVSLIAFMLGAVIAGRLANALAQATHRRWLTWAAALEIVCLLAAALCGLGYDHEAGQPEWSLYAMIATTAVAMGMRNATVLRLADPDLKTTVLTLTITGIAADSSLAGGSNPRLGRRTLSVLALFAGAGIGAALLQGLGTSASLLAMAALVCAATALYVLSRASLTSVSAKPSKPA